MYKMLLYLWLIVIALSVYSQESLGKYSESADEFIKRILPDTLKLAHPVIETNVWDKSNKSIIALYTYKLETADSIVFCHAYQKEDSSDYRDIEFGPIEGEHNSVEILSVFFANADKDKEKELFVLSKYRTQHYDADGYIYWTYVFDNPSIYYDKLDYLEEFSRTFYGCECYSQATGTQTEPKYKTAQSIKLKLKKMGF